MENNRDNDRDRDRDPQNDLLSTATFLRGVLERVERLLRSNNDQSSSTSTTQVAAAALPIVGGPSAGTLSSIPRSEMNRLFGYQPDSSQRVFQSGTRKRSRGMNSSGGAKTNL